MSTWALDRLAVMGARSAVRRLPLALALVLTVALWAFLVAVFRLARS